MKVRRKNLRVEEGKTVYDPAELTTGKGKGLVKKVFNKIRGEGKALILYKKEVLSSL